MAGRGQAVLGGSPTPRPRVLRGAASVLAGLLVGGWLSKKKKKAIKKLNL